MLNDAETSQNSSLKIKEISAKIKGFPKNFDSFKL
ncbi:hypothetical protein BCF50_0307 [Chryseobacterium daecheongense]|uniref:Uncharacterized protein n=1 Tax=Chryseobacterium daecheongense TaxID=192389 RepID=A0ABY2FXN0_9FLAO|nr:hypothetical protein BCF50_0307 [Chryseobacterium daecheongense]